MEGVTGAQVAGQPSGSSPGCRGHPGRAQTRLLLAGSHHGHGGSGDSWTLWVGPQVGPRIVGGGKLVHVSGRTHPPGGRFRGDLGAFPAGWSPSPVRLPPPVSPLRGFPSECPLSRWLM